MERRSFLKSLALLTVLPKFRVSVMEQLSQPTFTIPTWWERCTDANGVVYAALVDIDGGYLKFQCLGGPNRWEDEPISFIVRTSMAVAQHYCKGDFVMFYNPQNHVRIGHLSPDPYGIHLTPMEEIIESRNK